MGQKPTNATLKKLRQLSLVESDSDLACDDAGLDLKLLETSENHADEHSSPLGIRTVTIKADSRQLILRLDEPLSSTEGYAALLDPDTPEPLSFTKIIKTKAPNFSQKAASLHSRPTTVHNEPGLALSLIRS